MIGRWWSVDPMWEKYPSLNPYNYCVNNPIILLDPDGERPWFAHEKTKVLSGLRAAEVRYFKELGRDQALYDKGLQTTEGWRYFDPGIEVKGLSVYGKMSDIEKLKTTILIAGEYGKGLFSLGGDPRANTITGIEENTGAKVEYNIGETKLENTITGIFIEWKEGATVVRIRYTGQDKFGRTINIAIKEMTVEQYNSWIKELKEIQEEERKKEQENLNRN